MPISFSSLSGGSSFTVITSTGGTKTATLDKSYPAGTYLIEPKDADANLEIYLGASNGTQVGVATAGAKSITASASFLYVTTINADANNVITFTLKQSATLATKTDAVWSPPTITDITPSGLTNIDSSTTITGTNFATNVEVKFRKSDDSTLVTPKSTVRGSATSIIATRPDTFSPTDAPYDVVVTNPSTGLAATSLNAITAGAVPVWVTSTTLNTAQISQAFSQTISATDADGGSSITYAIVSGALHSGLSLNTNTGEITGTPTGSTSTDTITISATDSGGNAVNRTFTQTVNPNTITVDYLVVAGGGAGGGQHGGGGGAGGTRSTITSTGGGGTLESTFNFNKGAGPYTITVGAGAPRNYNGVDIRGANGNNSVFNTITSTGGGGGGSNGGNANGNDRGGGAGPSQNGGSAISGQGYPGGNCSSGNTYGGGGGGAGETGHQGATDASGTGGYGGNGIWTALTDAISHGQLSGGHYYIAGGGGAGGHSPINGVYGEGGQGGVGGGGAGGRFYGNEANSLPGTDGTIYTGSGGGGSGKNILNDRTTTINNAPGGGANYAGAGGSGVVILRFPGSFTVTSSTGSPSRSESGGYTYYKWTGDGSVTI